MRQPKSQNLAMAYDEDLARRIRAILQDRMDIAEKKMFGGLAFLAGEHMCCGVVKQELMVRVGPEQYEDALGMKHARPMDFTGRPLKGMVYVATAGLRTRQALRSWIMRGLRFTDSLPPK
ncbi:MAG TPA: TfoX/Sxy family protein [Thermoanaerobaculia bacterium]|nr:TfoX/Sxy family protein [Thermoanaerobaculia bacterium]